MCLDLGAEALQRRRANAVSLALVCYSASVSAADLYCYFVPTVAVLLIDELRVDCCATTRILAMSRSRVL